MITNSNLHFTILQEIIDNGFAPNVSELSKILSATENEIIKGLHDLQEYHGVVLHPNEPKVWVIHPFSLSPTNFYVKTQNGEWWGNCAWCSLGVAALLKDDVKIITTIGAETKQIEINIIDGEIQEKNYFIHFPIPMKNAWDNVIYTCSNMLVFENETQIEEWTKKHNISKGDIQPIEKIWNFSKKWYGNHLNPNWKKWTIEEAKEIFNEFDLKNKIWQLEDSNERF
ncbi:MULTISPECIES: alkylmercury lyase family protein [Flavobacterium]|uniref:Alkylmercury lyase n=1 Tax=Flavobacterium terrae TaxID=415425 RepID=A0A1M6HGP0_9FLAO|nr:alkylmercury lyase family protein [Flavobacterium terrae]MCB0745479.1 alkylmercury lyase family protein [Ignavibacteriota bacterium]MDA0199962.1 alkylmercury lyase family protein [Bacteroidota bacterium]SHJ21353.1 Alkylmercury lyase [Flavobacterium terrae]